MALREATRRWSMRCAWAALLVAGSLLVGLRVGRPVYYTDGTTQVDAQALAGAGMLRWRTPEAIAEVPGPVAGRVTELPDGRLLYGRRMEAGHADLVLWDPARPAVPPEPLFGCNTEHNELAPQRTADGALLFASDRPGGAGGYDLYRAPALHAAAAAIVPLAACNTALDESDPALHGNGSDLVFVRSDRRVDGGNDGVLWRWRLGDDLDPVPVWAMARPGQRAIDRDPVFAADGASLWFVRKLPAQPLTLQRASWLAGALDQPIRVGAEWGTAELRSPMPQLDGRRLSLVQARPTGAAVLLFQASAQELVPWWPGQRWLEWILLGIVVTSLVLLLLLHFGRRWSTLDLVAQCLLLSLLLHVLLFLWLMGVEIAGALLPGDDDSGGFEVSVLAASEAAAASGGADSTVGAEVVFTPSERAFAATAPASLAVRDNAASALAGPQGELPSEPAAQAVSAQAEVADAPTPIEAKQGQDAALPVAAVALPTLERSAAEPSGAAKAARSSAEREQVTVQAPGSGLPRSVAAAMALAAPAASAAAPNDASAALATPAAPVLLDAPSAGAVAAPSAAPDAPAAALLADAGAMPTAPASSMAATAARTAGTAAPLPAASEPAPAAALVRPGRAPLVAPAAPRRAEVAVGAASLPKMTTALRDAAAAATPVDTTAAAAGAPVAVSPRPHAGALVADPQRPAVAAARDARVDAPMPSRSTALPASSLARSRTSPPVGAASEPRPALAARSAVAPASVATLRDGAREPVMRTDRRSEGANPRPAPEPRMAAPTAPIADAAVRPARAADVGAARPRDPSPTPPRSELPRAVPAPVGLPAAAPLANSSAYSNRFGPAKAKAIERFGGSDATERAVQNGLRYLARIQHDDGAWGNREDYDGKYGFVHVGKTALCLLAFLGAGHTPASNTEHSGTAQKALAYLLAVQDEDSGAFGPSSCYGHGIATYALAECYGITKQAELLRPLERALTWILDHQGPRRDRRNRGGWGYFSPGLQAEDDYARVSVTSWMVMALESARLSGVDLPPTVLPAAREYLELAYDQPNGWFRYNHKPSRVNSSWPTLPASTPAAGFCLQLLGCAPDDERVAAAVRFTAERRPQRYRRYSDDDFVLRGQGNVYFWYYGTLCCFLAGGDAWAQWNERLRTVLPQAQSRDGSFAPIDVYAEEAGDTAQDRAYTTAMCVLCLEIYYRYFTPLLVGR